MRENSRFLYIAVVSLVRDDTQSVMGMPEQVKRQLAGAAESEKKPGIRIAYSGLPVQEGESAGKPGSVPLAR